MSHKEYWNDIINVYVGTLSLKSFKLGVVLGRENYVYLGIIYFGIDIF